MGTVLTLGACGGSEPAQPERPTPAVVIAPGTEDEPVTLRVNSDFRPPFETHEGYEFVVTGIGQRDSQEQRLTLARTHNPELPTDHEIQTAVSMGGWLAVGGAFYHYIRSEYKGLTFTMSFGSKVTVPMHDANSFLVGAGHSFLVRGRSSIVDIMTLTAPTLTTNWTEGSLGVGAIIQTDDGIRWKILAIEPAKDDLPAYAEIVRLPEDPKAGARLRSIPLR